MAEVYVLKIDTEITASLFQSLLSGIDTDKKDKILSYRRQEDAHRSLMADWLLRYVLITHHNFTNQEISFQYSYYGKPTLKEQHTIHFNTSHAGAWVVCAIDKNEIGIDVEKIIPTDLQVAEHYFSKKEQRYLTALPNAAQLSAFFQLWTLKESFVKMIGEGLSIPLDTFSILPSPSSAFTFTSETAIHHPVYFKTYPLEENYHLAACAKTPLPNAINTIRMADVLAQIRS